MGFGFPLLLESSIIASSSPDSPDESAAVDPFSSVYLTSDILIYSHRWLKQQSVVASEEPVNS